MSRFYNPYQFVPVTGRVGQRTRVGHADYADIAAGTASAHSGVRHDLWHADGFSGRILCSLYLDTPLVVGAGQRSDSRTGAMVVEQYRWRGVEAIPANSLKGMVSSVAEALSQSALRILSDNLISLRITDTKSSIGTRRVTHHLKSADYFKHIDTELVPWQKDRETLSPAELLFGAVEVNEKGENPDHGRNLAGRLRFHDALPAKRPVRLLDLVTLRILDSPKFYLSGDSKGCCVPFYLHLNGQGGGWLETDDVYHKYCNTEIWPNGRKFYLHHPAHQVQNGYWASATPRQRANLKLRCAPIAPGQTFHFHIDFENLSAAELTLLEHALAPGSGYRHRLGLAKSLGLGSLTLCIEAVCIIDPSKRYSASALAEPEKRYHQVWRPTHTPLVDGRERDFGATYTQERGMLNSAVSASKPEKYHDRSLIDQDTLNILLTIGDPRYLEGGISVHTPLTEEQIHAGSEDRTFEWFKDNKEQGRQALRAVRAGQPLPTLFSTPNEAKESGLTFASTVAFVKPTRNASANSPGTDPEIHAWLSKTLPKHIDPDEKRALTEYLKTKLAAEAWNAEQEPALKQKILKWWMGEVRALDPEMPMDNLLSNAAMRVLKNAGVNVSEY